MPHRPSHNTLATGLRSAILMGVGVVLGAACSAPDPPRDTAGADSRTTAPSVEELGLGPRDIIRVSVFGHAEASTPPEGTRVAADGTISLPLLGDVLVEGATPREVRIRLEEQLRRYYTNPSVAISVIEHRAHQFFIMGQVKMSGAFMLDRPLTLLEALTSAEQLMPGANRAEVALIRAHGEQLEVHFFNAETPDASGMTRIQPDDLLFVSRTGVGRFADEALPILQAMGYTAAQVTALGITLGN